MVYFNNRAPIYKIIVIIIICSIYILNLYKNELENKLENNEKNNEELKEKINYIKNLTNILFIISFLITILGVIIYIIISKQDKKYNFNVTKFLLGKKREECFSLKINNKFKKHSIFYDIK